MTPAGKSPELTLQCWKCDESLWSVCSSPCFSADGGVSWTLLHSCLLFRVFQRFLFVSQLRTHQHPAAWQHMSDITHMLLRGLMHVNESEICSMFQPGPHHGYKHVRSVSQPHHSWRPLLEFSWQSLHARSSSASLSADRDACLFSLGEFHLELLQPSRSDNPTALNSERCWKCYGDVTAATLSLWRQDFYGESTLTLPQTRDGEIKLTSHWSLIVSSDVVYEWQTQSSSENKRSFFIFGTLWSI